MISTKNKAFISKSNIFTWVWALNLNQGFSHRVSIVFAISLRWRWVFMIILESIVNVRLFLVCFISNRLFCYWSNQFNVIYCSNLSTEVRMGDIKAFYLSYYNWVFDTQWCENLFEVLFELSCYWIDLLKFNPFTC